MTTRSERQSVLYASYVSPHPADSGERIRASQLIQALSHLGYDVEAVVGNFDGADLQNCSTGTIRYHEIPFAWPRLRQEAGIYLRPNAAFLRQVEALHREHRFSAILLDYGFIGAHIAPLMRLGVPVILGTHNVESVLTGQAEKSSLAARLAIRLRQTVEWAHERWFFRKADAVISVSEEDRLAYERFIAKDRLHLVPNFVDIPDSFAGSERGNRIIMTGSFSNFQNITGLRWFMREVWDASLWTRTSFCIAGRHSDEVVAEFAQIPGVTALGARQSLITEIARSRCAIVPLWHGGGTRLKCLEAMATHTPVITTSKGCEGIAHDGAFFVVDTADAFRAAILDVLLRPNHASGAADKARRLFDREYSLPANAVRLQRALESATEQARQRQNRGHRSQSVMRNRSGLLSQELRP